MDDITALTAKWLEEEVKPKYKAIITAMPPGNAADGNEDIYANVIGELLDKAVSPEAYWLAEKGLKPLFDPYKRNGAPISVAQTTAVSPKGTGEVTMPEERPAAIDISDWTHYQRDSKGEFTHYGPKGTCWENWRVMLGKKGLFLAHEELDEKGGKFWNGYGDAAFLEPKEDEIISMKWNSKIPK